VAFTANFCVWPVGCGGGLTGLKAKEPVDGMHDQLQSCILTLTVIQFKGVSARGREVDDGCLVGLDSGPVKGAQNREAFEWRQPGSRRVDERSADARGPAADAENISILGKEIKGYISGLGDDKRSGEYRVKGLHGAQSGLESVTLSLNCPRKVSIYICRDVGKRPGERRHVRRVARS
jgi:hypothetical protein